MREWRGKKQVKKKKKSSLLIHTKVIFLFSKKLFKYCLSEKKFWFFSQNIKYWI